MPAPDRGTSGRSTGSIREAIARLLGAQTPLSPTSSETTRTTWGKSNPAPDDGSSGTRGEQPPTTQPKRNPVADPVDETTRARVAREMIERPDYASNPAPDQDNPRPRTNSGGSSPTPIPRRTPLA